MYFSEAYALQRSDIDDWFDPLMEIDTQLFVDPFLMFSEADGYWADSGDRFALHFQRGFEILAGHQARPQSVPYRKTVRLMHFPEPQEFGLGYVGKGTNGSGGGPGFAKKIVEAMALAIETGLSDLHHFEELGLLVDRIGKDRISDITCNIVKDKFIEYTQEVCDRHHVQLEEFEVVNSRFDIVRNSWATSKLALPRNPVTGGFVLLTPKRFLRELPTLNADDWWAFAEPELREDLNYALATRLPKKDIIDRARANTGLVREWSQSRESELAVPYDVDRDPEGLHNWQALTRHLGVEKPVEVGAVTEENLQEFIKLVNDRFAHFIEQEGGWRLLRNDDTGLPKSELSIQLLYKGVVQSYCHANSVVLDREVELGRGPVDFIFNGQNARVLMEIKKVRNGKFWNGLEDQLLSYIESDNASQGWFLAVRLTDSKTEKKRVAELASRTVALRLSTGLDIRSSWIDGRPKRSASELAGDGLDTRPSFDDPEFPDEIDLLDELTNPDPL